MENIENLKSWASQPDVCRCCLSTNGTWDLLSAYKNAGEKEIYSEILFGCFGISLSLLTGLGGGRLACDACVARLRDAHSFKKQVQRAEEQFVIYVNSRHDKNCLTVKRVDRRSENGVKKRKDKSLTRKRYKDNCTEEYGAPSSEVGHEYVAPSLKVGHENNVPSSEVGHENNVPSSEVGHKNNVPCSDVGHEYVAPSLKVGHENNAPSSEVDHEYDVPSSEVGHENNVPSSEVGYEYEPYEDNDKVGVTSTALQSRQTRPADVKQVSERKRIKLTCDTVLRDTTAVPFRHHHSWFRCFFCTQSFMDIPALSQHTTLTHADIEQQIKQLKRYPRSLQIEISELQCRRCHLNLTDVETMQLHFKSAHKQVIYKECIADYKINGSPYTCHLCMKQFHVFRTLTIHLNEHYANYICAVCGKSFLNSKRLKVHNRTHEVGAFPCPECGKVLKTKSSQANHIESHLERVIRCQICSKPMKHYNDRIKHMSEEHNITHTFKCPICSREYHIKHYLATHMRQTHGNKNNKCGECGMAFVTNYCLKKHMLKHSGVKAFSCTVCSKAYARNYTLREHMRVHDG